MLWLLLCVRVCVTNAVVLNPLYTGVAIVERSLSDAKMARALNDLSKSAQQLPKSLSDLSMISQ